MASSVFQIPEELELVAFFDGEAIERVVEDGYWCFEVVSAGDRTLRFSINLYERSVQTEIRDGRLTVVTVSHELATRLTVEGSRLRCEFVGSDCRTALVIDAAQGYKVNWSTLRTG